jgi:hypothetical protein
MAAVGVLAPRVAATAVLARDAATSARKTAFRIQPQERAVARRDGAA